MLRADHLLEVQSLLGRQSTLGSVGLYRNNPSLDHLYGVVKLGQSRVFLSNGRGTIFCVCFELDRVGVVRQFLPVPGHVHEKHIHVAGGDCGVGIQHCSEALPEGSLGKDAVGGRGVGPLAMLRKHSLGRSLYIGDEDEGSGWRLVRRTQDGGFSQFPNSGEDAANGGQFRDLDPGLVVYRLCRRFPVVDGDKGVAFDGIQEDGA